MSTAQPSSQHGLTLIELMVVIAIISIIAAIAIPAYNGYIRETRLGVGRVNADSIRLFLEDFQLDNGTYKAGGNTSFDTAALNASFNWTPDGDGGAYAYSVVNVTTNSYDILVTHRDGDWVRCENRMNSCCDGKAGEDNSACP